MFTAVKVLTKKPVEATPRNTYQLTVSFMHGDADHYTSLDLFFNQNEVEELLDTANFFQNCIKEYPHGRSPSSSYEGVDGYDKYGEHIEYDLYYEDGEATVDGIEVRYYDSKGDLYLASLIGKED